jgi:hypothetical protein
VRRPSPRVTAFVAVAVVVVLVVAGFVLAAWRAHVHAVSSAPTVASRDLATTLAEPHIVFRSTLPGSQYGFVAAVPLSDPGGPRAFTDQVCDRIDVAGSSASCLRTIAGIATRWEARVLDSSLKTVTTWGLPGIPSRTRLSDDGSLVATTVFVSGHSYVSVGFSTQTELHKIDGTDLGNVESFTLTVDGQPFNPSDKNIWGVTFIDDDTFYATAASQSAGKTWLVKGSISQHTLTSVQENAECPSVSPDRTKVAYKKVVDTVNGQSVWALAVRDIASGKETLIPATKGLDDQAEWLDNSTLLYGLARAGQPGTTDVWSVRTEADAQPTVLIPGAWSPAVSR